MAATLGSDTADICIVGGGLLGTATAYFSSLEGARVIVLEAEDLASGASGAAFGGISAGIYSYASTRVPEQYVALSLASLQLYHELEEELGPPLDIVWRPSLDPFEDEQARDRVAERVAGLQADGVPARLVGKDELGDLEPALSKKVVGASYCPIDGHVTPLNAVWALTAGAQQRGAEFRTGVSAEEILVRDGRAIGVRTRSGTVNAEWVVIAAGLGTRRLAASAGVAVPIVFSRGQMFVTERVPPMLQTFLHTIKQTQAGTVVIGATKEAEISDTATSVDGTRSMLADAVGLIPRLAEARLLRSWAGVRPVPVDGYPILGPVDGVDGLLVAVMHRGVTLAPIVGRILTDLMSSGETALDIAPYRLTRFPEEENGVRASEAADNY